MGTSTDCPTPKTLDWRTAKGRVTRAARRGTYTNPIIQHVIAGYVTASGGVVAVASGNSNLGGTSALQQTMRQLAGYLSASVPSEAPPPGALTGPPAPVNALLHEMFQAVGGPANTIDQCDVRAALMRVVTDWFNGMTSPEERAAVLGAHASNPAIADVLVQLCGYYLAEQVTRIFTARLRAVVGQRAADDFFWALRLYIDHALDRSDLVRQVRALDLRSIDWQGPFGKAMADALLLDVLRVLIDPPDTGDRRDLR